jgi:transposase
MLGRQERRQQTLFLTCQLCDLVPGDHILKRVDRVLDLSWLADEVGALYAAGQGRPSIDPEAAVRLMLAGFFEGIVHDRKLLRQAHVNVAIRWFCGYGLDEPLPDHSSLTRIRQRWGAVRFRRIFERTVAACVAAGLVTGETVHVDATLIRADVSWESLVARHVEQSLQLNEVADEPTAADEAAPGDQGEATRSGSRVSRTDPDARVAKAGRTQHGEPAYKQLTAVDDAAGVIVDVAIEPGTAAEGAQLVEQLERVASTTGRAVGRVTADKGYSSAANYAALEARGIEAIIAPERVGRHTGALPGRRFKYDARHDVVRCPRGRVLRHRAFDGERHHYRAETAACRRCRWRAACLAPSARARTVRLQPGHDALVRARRRGARSDEQWRRLMGRHRWQVEGVHGEAKSQHGLRRAARRRLWNVSIQAYLTAVAINLKRLARAVCGPPIEGARRGIRAFTRWLLCLIAPCLRHLCPA